MKELEKIIREILDNDTIEISPELQLKGDLGFDSLRLVRLVAEVEERYHIEISDEDFGRIRTVQDVWKFMEKEGGQL